MATVNNYDELYESMKNRLTVVNENSEYTIGDYMLMKASKKKEESRALAAKATVNHAEQTMANVVSYINDKLTIKEPPIKDKTIRAFPFRASASAFLTASVACAFLLSFVLIGAKSMANQTPVANDVVITETENTGVGFVEDLNK